MVPLPIAAGPNIALLAGVALSAIASLLHVGITIGGASWYRFLVPAKRWHALPKMAACTPLVTAGIAAMLALWGMFALAGADLIAPLPALKPTLVLITTVYLPCGLLIVVLLTPARSKSTRFLVWSSVVCLVYGVVHLISLVQVWSRL